MNLSQAKAAGKKVLAIIDGKSVFYRGYYAMPHLTMRDGTPTGGVYGFAALALELVRRIQPDYVAVAWDKPKTNIRRRKAIYAGYKSNRHPAPPDFYAQIPVLHELLRALHWPLYEADDYEADDIMGTLSEKANADGIHTILISSDMDMLQLVDDDTELYAMKKGLSNLEKIDVKTFEDKYGLKVNQFLDLKSLKGDASDCIPGVKGIGEKTAIKLLQEYKTLDGVYAHVDEIGGAVHDRLVADKDSAYMSRELGKIWCTAPTPLDLPAMDVTKIDRQALHQMLLKLEFTSLIKRLPDGMKLDGEARPHLSKEKQMTGAGFQSGKALAGAASQANDDEAKAGSSGEPSVELTVFELADLPAELASTVTAVVVNDVLYLSDKPGVAYRATFSRAAELLAGHQIVAHDLKDLAKHFLNRNLPVDWTTEFDTKHAGFLLDSLRKPLELADYLELSGTTNPQPLNYLEAVDQLWRELAPKLRAETKLDHLARTVDFPLQIVLARIEQRGVLVDPAILSQMSDQLAGEIDDLQRQIWQAVGYEFNIGSPKQLSEALFDKLNLPPTAKRNKSGNYPTGAKELAKLANAHLVVPLISQYRELTKLKSTYVDTLPKNIGPDGRIHTTFDQDVTATGRLSSSNPNLQNIPTRTERGKEIKKAFVAPAGQVIINADYAQFELRLAAAMAHDDKMIAMFADPNNDIHTMTAAEAYGIPVDQVTPEQRRHAKVINFGVLYGMSPHGLVEATGMDFTTAKAFIARYFTIRKPIRDFLDQTLKQADELGYVETLFGRRRPTPDVKSSNFMVREGAKRAAANMPIQGTEADLMKMAMLKVEREIPQAAQIMQVHDSIMVECAEAGADEVAAQMKQIMENIYPDLGVRLLVDAKIGHDWSTL